MARDTADAAAQRTDYGNKTGEAGHDKLLSSKRADMTKGGAANSDGSGGPTGSSRHYPKGGKPNLSADFNPLKDSKRGATDWAVGGV
jgi:hypothetical protein